MNESEPPIDFSQARYQKLLRVKRELHERIREIDGELALLAIGSPFHHHRFRVIDSWASLEALPPLLVEEEPPPT